MIKTLSLFSGIGAFEKALESLDIRHEVTSYCEIDKYASCGYSAIHDISEEYNLGDITKVDISSLKDFDLLTHGSPCQDFSLSGKGRGGNEGTNTRSSLMWNSVEIIKRKTPSYVIWENVKGVLCKNHKHNFEKYLNTLDELGYKNYHKVLNSRDSGAPQGRERIFVVSIKNDINKNFKFKQRINEELKLRDILEDNVDTKYYLKGNHIKSLTKEFEGRLNNREASKLGLIKVGDIKNPKSFQMNNRVFSKDGVSPTLTTTNPVKIVECRIRSLTPLESWRATGFSDEDYWKARKALEKKFYKGKDRTDSQMYKMSGNSIVVDVLEDIFRELFID
ncbi:DNA (cytosine-5)-methyltransferase 1 [Clostridium amylolyticum]|uniref:Cytosine-specific methyltransferase n=1 Tax=Clostridium amylolyticum TaxID=1121298 RepID=A0A1M6L011_9CLOT|nr:DNA (cytosine-5-)-methyltransferase [Clostridium amylolyticum]SHJ64565.1 DNA (cytosine-5)-methyltransferase 1 [Clostridium amylolyticum]